MKLPRWVKIPFCFVIYLGFQFARIRYLVPIAISLMLLGNLTYISVWGDIDWKDWLFPPMFLAALIVQYYADIQREEWEANKLSGEAHVRRHEIYAFTLFLFWFYCAVAIDNIFYSAWIIITVFCFELFLVARHKSKPDKLAPPRPLPKFADIFKK